MNPMMEDRKMARGFGHYPTPVSQRSGCKVGWMTFATKADAEKCARAARLEAKRQAENGYDFGYCTPGSIEKIGADRWEVCIP